VAALDSECSDVRTIQMIGATNSSAIAHAASPPTHA
jgi:hypothetical protein